MKVKIGFTPMFSGWHPEDILGFDEDCYPIVKEGAKPWPHSWWAAFYKFTHDGKQYGQYVYSAENFNGFNPGSIPKDFYKQTPKMLYGFAKEALQQLEVQ